MIVDGIDFPVSWRLYQFRCSVYIRRLDISWLDEQENGIHCLMTTDCNNDEPCKFARSRGE